MLASWTWSLALIVLTTAMHSFGIVVLSVDSMTTRGASGLVLHQHWQLMGALEAVAGMLMFGISTAYVFQVLLLYWPDLQAVWERDEKQRELLIRR